MSYQINDKKYLTIDELAQLNEVLARHSTTRDVVLIQLILATGARASEALNIQVDDLNHATKTVLIKGIKGSLDRTIPLSQDLFDRVKSLRGANRIFEISYRRLSQVWNEYRPSKKGIHCLRHTFAINLYRKTKDIRLVQSALGHKSITNTMVYATYVYTTDELRKALVS